MVNDSLRKGFEGLINEFGKENVAAAAEQLCKASVRQTPAEYLQVLAPQVLEDTVHQLNAANSDIITAGNEREAAYGNKKDLLRRKAQLAAEVEITEAEAFMQITGDGKTAEGKLPDGSTMAVTNDKLRDAFRRIHSANIRKELAQVEGDLAALEIDIQQKKDAWETTVEASTNIQKKAGLQAYLLRFLSR